MFAILKSVQQNIFKFCKALFASLKPPPAITLDSIRNFYNAGSVKFLKWQTGEYLFNLRQVFKNVGREIKEKNDLRDYLIELKLTDGREKAVHFGGYSGL